LALISACFVSQSSHSSFDFRSRFCGDAGTIFFEGFAASRDSKFVAAMLQLRNGLRVVVFLKSLPKTLREIIIVVG